LNFDAHGVNDNGACRHREKPSPFRAALHSNRSWEWRGLRDVEWLAIQMDDQHKSNARVVASIAGFEEATMTVDLADGSRAARMTRWEYADALEALGADHAEAAKLLGCSPRTSRRYADGTRKISGPVSTLIKLHLSRPREPVPPERDGCLSGDLTAKPVGTFQLPATIDVATAWLPAAYENAKIALAQCDAIDQCKEMADKAEALASYARQANDLELRQMADRIQARAIRRCGELLRQIEPASEMNLKQNRRDGTVPSVTRTQAATDAGLSERQRKTAIRVATVPVAEFERSVESPNPPSVTALAERGKERSKPSPLTVNAASAKALALWDRLRAFASDGTLAEDPNEVMDTMTDAMRNEVHVLAPRVAAWLQRIGKPISLQAEGMAKPTT